MLLWTHAQIQAVISKRTLLKSTRSDLLCSSVSCPYPRFLTAHPENNWQGVSKNKHLLFKMCLRFPSFALGILRRKKHFFGGENWTQKAFLNLIPKGNSEKMSWSSGSGSRLSPPPFTKHKICPLKKWAAEEKLQIQSNRKKNLGSHLYPSGVYPFSLGVVRHQPELANNSHSDNCC